VTCPSDKPYFDPKTNNCSACPSPSVYTASTGRCTATVTNTTSMTNYIESGNFTKANL
jgi:hypothetical protein